MLPAVAAGRPHCGLATQQQRPAVAGGVFEEAIAEAALLLGSGCKIVETMRGSGAAVDAAFWTGRLSHEVTFLKTYFMHRLLLHLLCEACQ